MRARTALFAAAPVLGALAALIGPPKDASAQQETFVAEHRDETHPYQDRLVCVRAPGSILKGVMYDVSGGRRVALTEFSTGHVGACELAIRASRNGRVCVTDGFRYSIRDLGAGSTSGQYRTLAECMSVTRGAGPLRTEPGFVEFIPAAELRPFVDALPQLSDPTVDAIVRAPSTMWYDEASLVYVYQDSFGSPKGLRANRVGYDVGANASEPDIRLLTQYFQPGKFKFPFSVTAGAEFSDNTYVLNFWSTPRTGSTAAPVRVWRNRSHWEWVFPVGTVMGEVLYLQAPDDGSWHVFEVRVRTRLADRWEASVFRPFATADEMAEAIKARRPRWEGSDLRALVTHLTDPSTLRPHTLSSTSYEAIVPSITGHMDVLPATTDTALIKELLRGPFAKANGKVWKSNGAAVAWGPATDAPFQVVPRGFTGGMLEISDRACQRCHEHTSRPLNNLDGRVVLYGEVWGEDQVFSWHPFAIDEDTFSVSDGNRRMNPRLRTAGLVDERPPGSDAQYRVLPKPFRAEYE
jgi:hypothetical protein